MAERLVRWQPKQASSTSFLSPVDLGLANTGLLAGHKAYETWEGVLGAPGQQFPKIGAWRARRAGPRESQDSPYLPTNPRDVHSPPSTAKNKNAESRAHHPNSRPPRRRPTPHPTPTPGASTYAPSASCADDATWSYGTKASNTCAYVARKLKRCKAKNTDGVRTALEACPVTCSTC